MLLFESQGLSTVRLGVLALAAALTLLCGPARAQLAQTSGLGYTGQIAAIVNEDVITMYDVRARMGMVFVTSGIENTPENQRAQLPVVLDALIYERLKSQEARRLRVYTTETDIRQAIDMFEQQRGMPPGTFRKVLTENSIDMGTLYSQVDADISWAKITRQELRRDVSIAPEEVKTVMARLRANQGKPEYNVAEIVLPVNATAPEADARALAQRVVQQARAGTTPFGALAQNFSQSATAAIGGELGWVMSGDLESEVEAALARMEPKEISDPIRTATGYHIVQLIGKSVSGAPNPYMSLVTMSQIRVPTVGSRAPTPARQQDILRAVSTQAGNCEQMNALAKDMGGPGSGPVQEMRLGQLPENVAKAVMDLPINRVSAPIEMTGARVFAMLCSRKDDSGLPSEDQVREKIELDKLESVAQQRLRDLRRLALVEKRL